jgi:hypothetical protein
VDVTPRFGAKANHRLTCLSSLAYSTEFWLINTLIKNFFLLYHNVLGLLIIMQEFDIEVADPCMTTETVIKDVPKHFSRRPFLCQDLSLYHSCHFVV